MMIGFEYDDGGRRESGRRGDAGDCVTRALAILTSGDYDALYREMAAANGTQTGKRSARNGVSRKVMWPVYESHGLRRVKLGRGAKPTYTEAYERYGDCIVQTAKHVAAIVDGKLRDTFDGRVYTWDDGWERERKAMSVWVLGAGAPKPQPKPEPTHELGQMSLGL